MSVPPPVASPPEVVANPPRRRRGPGPSRAGLTSSRSSASLAAKLLMLALVNALGVYGVIVLYANGSWTALAAMVTGLVAIDYVYLSKRTVPAKYLLPGVLFLLVYQVYVVLYTGYAAFTNYGDGHNNSKSTAISTILANTENRVPDSAAYRLTVVDKGGTLGFLVTAPDGSALVGTAKEPLAPAREVTRGTGDRAVSIPGYTSLTFPQILARQQEVTTLRVPFEDPKAGSLRTPDGSNAFVYRSTLTYDSAGDAMVDTTKGTVYRNDGEGYFRAPDGKVLDPGWKVGVGFANFTKIVRDDGIRGPFVGVLIWTFAFAFLSVLTTFALGLLLAIVLNEERMRGRRVYRSLLLLPYAVPAFMSGLIWAGMMNTDFGFINQILLGGAHVTWLTTPWLARFSVLLVNLWLGFPYWFLICTGALQSIPGELTEAARVDGAGPFRVFRSIKLPLLLIAVGPLLIASFAFNFNNFNTIYMLTGGNPKILGAKIDVGSTDILITMVYKVAFGGTNRQYGFACAVSIIIFFIVATLSAISFRKTRALEEIN